MNDFIFIYILADSAAPGSFMPFAAIYLGSGCWFFVAFAVENRIKMSELTFKLKVIEAGIQMGAFHEGAPWGHIRICNKFKLNFCSCIPQFDGLIFHDGRAIKYGIWDAVQHSVWTMDGWIVRSTRDLWAVTARIPNSNTSKMCEFLLKFIACIGYPLSNVHCLYAAVVSRIVQLRVLSQNSEMEIFRVRVSFSLEKCWCAANAISETAKKNMADPMLAALAVWWKSPGWYSSASAPATRSISIICFYAFAADYELGSRVVTKFWLNFREFASYWGRGHRATQVHSLISWCGLQHTYMNMALPRQIKIVFSLRYSNSERIWDAHTAYPNHPFPRNSSDAPTPDEMTIAARWDKSHRIVQPKFVSSGRFAAPLHEVSIDLSVLVWNSLQTRLVHSLSRDILLKLVDTSIWVFRLPFYSRISIFQLQ